MLLVRLNPTKVRLQSGLGSIEMRRMAQQPTGGRGFKLCRCTHAMRVLRRLAYEYKLHQRFQCISLVSVVVACAVAVLGLLIFSGLIDRGNGRNGQESGASIRLGTGGLGTKLSPGECPVMMDRAEQPDHESVPATLDVTDASARGLRGKFTVITQVYGRVSAPEL